MPSDYFKLDVHFFEHPKVIDLSDAAVRLYLAAVAYANRRMTDGLVAAPVVRRLVEHPDPAMLAAELVKAMLWHEAEGGYRIHDFTEHNKTRAERLSLRDRERTRKADYRDRQRTGRDVPAGQDDLSQRDSPGHVPMSPPGEERRGEERTGEPSSETGADDGTPGPTHPPVSLPSEARPEPEQPEASNEHDPPLVSIEHPEAHRLCELLADLIHANTGERPSVGKRWVDAARLMLTRDNYTPEQVEYLVRWCQADEFWRSNILSMPKLREKRLTLVAQAKRARNGNGTRATDDADRKRASVLSLLEA